MNNTELISKKDICINSSSILCAYIQIPFCRSVCHFCCWSSYYTKSEILSLDRYRDSYIQALKREIRARSLSFQEKNQVDLKVIHFGGGSPSLLEPEELKDILHTLIKSFAVQLDQVMTVGVEVRPDDLTPEMLDGLKSAGFNRISIGVQSFDPTILKRLGRRIPVEQIYQTFDLVRAAGFKDVNIDLLYGFPFQTFEHIVKDIDSVIKLDPDHIDAHPWKPVPGPLYKEVEGNYQKDKANKVAWTRYMHDRLQESGYVNYNHRCFAKPGKENLMHLVEATYCLPFLAFGAGCEQYHYAKTTTSIEEYIDDPFTSELYTKSYSDSYEFNLLWFIGSMIRLLLLPEGLNIRYFNEKYNCDLEDIISFYRNPDNMNKELKKYKDTRFFLFEASRIQIFKKMLHWMDRGIIEKRGEYLCLVDDYKISQETWVLYMQAC